MLKYIADLLSSIGQFFASIGEFFVDTFKDLAYIVSLLKQTTPFISNFLSIFPGIVVTSVGLIISIAIIYKFVGREG